MKATVDRLSDELSAKYLIYLETFIVDLSSDASAIEFRYCFALRSDHVRRSFKFDVRAVRGDTEKVQKLIIQMIFEAIEEIIDEAIAAGLQAAN